MCYCLKDYLEFLFDKIFIGTDKRTTTLIYMTICIFMFLSYLPKSSLCFLSRITVYVFGGFESRWFYAAKKGTVAQ